MKFRYLLFLVFVSPVLSFAQTPDTLSDQKADSTFQNESVKQSVDEVPTITLTDEDLKESPPSNVASVLTASRDVFTSAASYTFSIAHFRIRGYDAGNEIPLMNGAPMMNLENNRGLYSDWSGLNDMVRGRDISLGLAPSTFSFGDIAGAYTIDSRASHQRKQLQVSYAISNRSYDNRVMLSYGSGIIKNGWSYALSGSRRWADEGYVAGTYYDGWSYFGAVEKKINNEHSLALTAFGAPTKNGRSSPATAEMYDLAGTHYYNPDWGYQDGKKRNAVVGNRNQPTLILTHDWKINPKSSLESAVSYQFGKDKVSGLDWFNAPDPRPDYYRTLPSYVDQNATTQAEADNLFRTDENARQINWSHLYEANEQNIETVNGVTGARSLYVLRNRVSDNKIFTFNTVYNETLNDHTSLNGGLTYQSQSSEHYTEINDLLGGDFYVDLNKFADTSTVNAGNISAIQNDLNNPDRILHKGDKYGYDYVSHISKSTAWIQTVYKFDRIDFFFGASSAVNSFHRTGKYRNGIFPDDSYGDSKKQNFFSGGLKTGLTYKINGRNYVYVNGGYLSKAPEFGDAYISPTTRNTVADNLRNENIKSIEGGYILRAPRLKARLTGYYTAFTEQTKTIRFLLAGNATSFVNFTMTGLDQTHSGIEAAVDANLGSGFTAGAVASVGQYYYSSRPVATATIDNNDVTVFKNETLYIKNLKVSGTPQSAYSAGLSYRSPKFWFVNVNFNYFDDIYLDFSPARRRLAVLDAIDEGSPLWNDVLSQEKEKGQFTIDASAGYSIKLKSVKGLFKNTFVVFNAGVTNITNNQDLVISGYEQLRLSPQGSMTDLNQFPPKFSYAFGTTFFASIALRMN